MSERGRPRTATILKLLSGSGYHNPQRLRDDAAVKPRGRPVPLTWLALDERERRTFHWLTRNATLPTVHGRADSVLLAKLAKLAKAIHISVTLEARLQDVNTTTYGSDFRRWRQSVEQVMRLMSELSLTPAARLKLAPPLPPGGAGGWDEIG